jgi:hypothetical protein
LFNNILLSTVGDVLSVGLPLAFVAGAQLRLFNAGGAPVSSYTVDGNTTSIDVAHLPAGNYLLQLMNNKGSYTRSLIVSYSKLPVVAKN